MSSEVIFIIGGARSGKSRFALGLAADRPGRKAFVATAEPGDEEMRERIAKHRRERGGGWETFEEPLAVPGLLRRVAAGHETVLVDCLTLWVSNLLHGEPGALPQQFDDLVQALADVRGARILLVSNEVGMGIVPATALARRFQDEAGRLHQMVAAVAGQVVLMTAGIPLRVK